MSRLPRSLRVLSEPATVFREIVASGRGFAALFGFLAIELLLARPLDLASIGMRITASPLAGLASLWSAFVSFALPPVIGLFLVGIALHYRSRRGTRLDLWTAVSVIAYTWAPHVLLVALGVILAGFGLIHPVMPHYPFGHPALTDGLKVVKALVELTPTIALAVVAFHTTLTPPGREQSAPQARAVATLVVCGALLLGGLGAAGYDTWSNWASARPLLPGDTLPAFALPGLDGTQVQRADLRGDVVLLDFWATWCPPCVESMPHLEKLHRDLGNRGFRLVSINTEPDDLPAVRAFIREHGLTFPIYIDRGLQSRFRVDTLPTAFLVAPDGEVRDMYIGSISAGRLRQAIEELLPR